MKIGSKEFLDLQKRVARAHQALANELPKFASQWKVINLRTKKIVGSFPSRQAANDFMQEQKNAKNLLLEPPVSQPIIVHM